MVLKMRASKIIIYLSVIIALAGMAGSANACSSLLVKHPNATSLSHHHATLAKHVSIRDQQSTERRSAARGDHSHPVNPSECMQHCTQHSGKVLLASRFEEFGLAPQINFYGAALQGGLRDFNVHILERATGPPSKSVVQRKTTLKTLLALNMRQRN